MPYPAECGGIQVFFIEFFGNFFLIYIIYFFFIFLFERYKLYTAEYETIEEEEPSRFQDSYERTLVHSFDGEIEPPIVNNEGEQPTPVGMIKTGRH